MTSTRRLLLVAGGGILGLGAAAILLILLVTPGGPPSGVSADGVPGAGYVPPPLPQLPGPLALRPENPPPPLIVTPAPPPPAAGTWEAVPQVARAAEAGPVGAAVGRELNELQPRLAACFDEDRQARHGRDVVSRSGDALPMEDSGTTILVLQVEAGGGRARIVDAPVETQGGASDGLVACAQQVLRGHVVQTPAAKAPARYRILFTLLR